MLICRPTSGAFLCSYANDRPECISELGLSVVSKRPSVTTARGFHRKYMARLFPPTFCHPRASRSLPPSLFPSHGVDEPPVLFALLSQLCICPPCTLPMITIDSIPLKSVDQCPNVYDRMLIVILRFPSFMTLINRAD